MSQNTNQDSKVILITGASSGIGKASAKRLIQEGHTVYVTARSIDKMNDLKNLGGIPIKHDVTDYFNSEEVVNKIIEEQGRIDVLFNNAGFGLYGAVEDIPLDDAKYQFDVCLFGLAKLTQLVLPHMRKQGSGKIINTSSMGGKIYFPLGAWYHAVKHAVEGWSDSLRLDLKEFNIKVVILEPGLIDTNFGSTMGEGLLKHSGEGPYSDLTHRFIEATKEGNSYTDPDVIAKVVSKIIKSKKPKTRYVAGAMARPLMFVRKWLGDRIFDRVIMSNF